MTKDERDRIWEKHRPYLEMLAEVNNSSVYVAEYQTGYWFLSDNFRIFGYDPQTIHSTDKAPDFLETRIHPDDFIVMEATQRNLLKFLESLPLDERKNYKHIYELRARNGENVYIRFIVQQQILELDEDGHPQLLFGIIDVSPDTSPLEQVKLRVINYKTGEIVPFQVIGKHTDIRLSIREKEILELARKGMQSKEISDKLSISIHTVNKHRQNIMQKMNADNVLEAIEYARMLGLVD